MLVLKQLKLPFAVFTFVALFLVPIELFVNAKMLLLDRFFTGGGWLEIGIISGYGAFIAYKMQDPKNVPTWRIRSWTIFTIFFFSQLLLGILVSDKFFLSGKLHLPIPMMMLAGPIYRAQLSIMTLLFLSTIILTGPAWCSQLCYFGALDGLASKGKKGKQKFKVSMPLKNTLLATIIVGAIALRYSGLSNTTASIIALTFGFIGLLVMLFFSRKKKQMIHCLHYCPIGTIVNYAKIINPFRITINDTCTQCMACSSACKYNALNPENIASKKPGITCTLCGDCLQSCHQQSIEYKFWGLPPKKARTLYLFLSISLHAIFMAMGRI